MCMVVLQVCHFQEKVTKRQSLSSCSPEPPTSAHTPEHPDSVTECHTEDALEYSEMNTNDLEDQHGNTHATGNGKTQPEDNFLKRDTVIKDKRKVKQVQNLMENGENLEDENGDKQRDTHMEDHTVTSRWVMSYAACK